nr:MAG TPA: hypothetical protein [Caudoviricetes sp.]
MTNGLRSDIIIIEKRKGGVHYDVRLYNFYTVSKRKQD